MTTVMPPSDLSNTPILETPNKPARARRRARNSATTSAFLKKVRQFANTLGEKRLVLLTCEVEITADSFERGAVGAEAYVRELLELIEAVHGVSLRSLKWFRGIPVDACNVEGEGWNTKDAAGVLALAAAELARVAKTLEEGEAA